MTDAGGSFVTVASVQGSFDLKPDITERLKARYEALVRIELAAGPG